ncbi:little elongation complex subunit 2 isoform X1 [Apodemus sylvaticus]|uniref:little elongation complex subunit 2 isoform X1 n=1 Tax=Apodemus sylvaticus TaxID=10129 RepID=UPI002244D691|nr:little elongation complex subunit 2 isoform X1 [Apodemus sylvaticus]XP_052043869.1 little elongation complex subunit 2 isoform X1 [Apodemus sylvaticus]XP_052043870.1 little elongation complex subunit 2 isoform X1 [Apodemus sylvaticus]XP_052043871.1 little elongation complex subunit 2 isoform X1 [Apodemus sylvaticus]
MSSSITMSEPRLNWDVTPKNGLKAFFSPENYKDHSMAPSLKELYILSNRRIGENLSVSASSVENEPAVSSATQAKEKVGMIFLPKPRVPYPRFSRFSQREQRTYVDLLVKYAKIPSNSKTVVTNTNEYLHYLDMKKHVNEEVNEFLKFLQNSAKKCAQDYNMLSDEAHLFTEQILRACIEQVKKYPEFYTLHEVTSLMGFFPFKIEMGLKLEKTLLVLGSAKFVKTAFPSMPVKLQLSKEDMSSIEIPKQKAEAMHCDISKDLNAEKLVSRYHPQIALTSQALFTLLNNHGPSYKEQWEIPVCVQMIAVEGSKPVKIIYINSPLPRKQMTMRERNQIFHEVPLKHIISKNTSVPVSAVFMDKPEEYTSEVDISTEASECRKIETLENLDMDFDGDVTELETFGVTTTSPPRSPSSESDSSAPIMTDVHTAPKVPTVPVVPAVPVAPALPVAPTMPVAPAMPEESAAPNITDDSRSLCQILLKQLQKEKQLFSGVESGSEGCKNKDDQGLEPCAEEVPSANAKSLTQDNEVHRTESDVAVLRTNDERQIVQGNADNPTKTATVSETAESEKGIPCGSDTDEDCLIIDTESKSTDGKTANLGSSPNSLAKPSAGNQATTAVSEESCVLKKPIKRVYKKFDPVGEILKMQDELLKPVSRKVPELPLTNSEESKQPSASEQPSAASDASTWPKSSWPSAFQKPKGRLPYELQDYVEDTSEYIAPQEGNFVYKLFSLQDLLLLVRCSVQRVETRPRSKKRKKIRRQFPVYVLPKVEYQGCYGVEALTESELCRFWTESLLHSNCSFYVGHIDAFTSKLFMLEEITSEELKEKLAALKISSLFNILQHILKKLCSLQEGSYLLSHAAEDSSLLIYKTSDGKVTRTAYNLHKAHCDLPGVPSSLSVPWVPLDPSYLLPYHIHHGRIPCTFPPKSLRPAAQPKVGGTRIPTHNHRNPVSMETKSSCLPVQQVENEGVARNKRKIM